MDNNDILKQNERLKATIKAFEKYLPRRIVEKITTNPYNIRVEGERRFVTILFGDVSGFTALSERLDPEDVIKVINKYFNKMLYIVEKYGGDVDKFVGDAIMVVFGAPVAHKDDPERAVRAALEMQEAIETIEPVKAGDIFVKVRMSIGINTGEIVALNMGTDDRMEYTVMGDNVNLSARLEAFANATEVIISDRTYKYVKDVFDIEILEPIMVKGKTEPIPVFKVLNVKDKQQKENEYPVIGYDSELRDIDNAVSGYAEGRAFSFLLTGEQGTGKTRILEYAYDKIDRKNFDLWEFRGEAFSSEDPLGAVKKAVQSILKIQNTDSADILKGKIDNVVPEDERMGLYLLFGISETEGMKEQQILKMVQTSLECIIRQMSSKNSIVLSFADMHYFDSLSVKLVEHLCRFLNDNSISYAASSRNPDSSISETVYQTRILNRAETGMLASSRLGKDVSEKLSDLLYDRAKGNPLYIIELLKLLTEKEAIDVSGSKAEIKSDIKGIVPDSLKSVFLEKIDSLDEELKTILQYSSILGVSFDRNLLSSVFKYEAGRTEDTLKSLEERGYITFLGGNEYQFSSELFHEAVYNSLMKNRRKEYHNIAGLYIEDSYLENENTDMLRRMTYHFDKAENPVKAPEYLEKTADTDMKFFAYDNALEMYNKAISYRETKKQTRLINTLILKTVLIHSVKGMREYALDELKRREEQFRENPADASKYCNHLGILYEKLGNMDKAMESYSRSLKYAAESGIPELIAQTNNQLGVSSIVMGKYEDALKYFNRAVEQNMKLNRQNDISRQYVNIGRVYMHMGDNKSAVKYFDMALEIQDKNDIKNAKLVTLINLGFLYDSEGDYEKAEQTYNEAMHIAEITGNMNEEARIMNNLGNIYINTGRVEQALDIFKKIGDIYENIGDKKGTAEVYTNIAEIDQMLGSFEEARSYFEKAIELCIETGHEHLHVYAGIQYANSLMFLGYLQKAEEMLNESLLKGKKLNIPDFIIMAKHILGKLKGLTGDITSEEQLLDEARKLSEEIGNPEFSANIKTTIVKAMAEKGEYEKAITLSESIMEYAHKNGNDILLSDIMASVTDIYLRTGNNEKLTEMANESFAIAEKTNSALSLMRNLLVISRYYLSSEDFTSTEECLKQAEIYAEQTGSIEHKIIVYRTMRDMYAATGNMPQKNNAMLKCLNTVEQYVNYAGTAYHDMLLNTRNLKTDAAEYIMESLEQYDMEYIKDQLKNHNSEVIESAVSYIKENRLLPDSISDKIL